MFRVIHRLAVRTAAIAVSTLALVAGSFGSASAIEAYIFRGAGDFSFIQKRLSFSHGMDNLAAKLEAQGVHSQVYRFEFAEAAYRDILKRKPESVAIMGHSMGALAAIAMANRLQGSGIRVAYLGLLDIPGPVGVAPHNAERADNFFTLVGIYGTLVAPSGYKGKVTNQFQLGQIHISLDDSPKVHDTIIAAIADAAPPVEAATELALTVEENPAAVENDETIKEIEKVLEKKVKQTTVAAAKAPKKLPPIE